MLYNKIRMKKHNNSYDHGNEQFDYIIMFHMTLLDTFSLLHVT